MKIKTLAVTCVATALAAGLAMPATAAWDEYLLPEEQALGTGSFLLEPDTLTVVVGETRDLSALLRFDLSNGTVKWSSSSYSVARADDSGMLTAKSEGSCVLTATYTGRSGAKRTQSCRIDVIKTGGIANSTYVEYDEARTVKYQDETHRSRTREVWGEFVTSKDVATASALQLKAGETIDLAQLLYPGGTTGEDVGTITWSSSDKEVATASGGQLKAKAAGSCTITTHHTNPLGKVRTQRIVITVT